jgi:iron(III) transport system permease protein
VRNRTSHRQISESARVTRSAGGTVRNAVPVALGPLARVIGWVLLGGVVLLALVVPLTSLMLRAFEGSRRPLDWAELLRATGASISVSALGAAIALILALPVAALAARYRNRTSRLIEQGAFAGHALPGVVVGLALVFLTVSLLPGIYQTSFTLGFAYAVLFLPKAIGSTRTAIAAVPESLEDVARSLGRTGMAAWWMVTARLSWTGALAGALLVMLTAMKELPATLMLRPTGMDTLATELWSRTEVAAYGAAAPYALALVAIAAIPAWFVARAVTATDAVTL